jgi:hypothetical protein
MAGRILAPTCMQLQAEAGLGAQELGGLRGLHPSRVKTVGRYTAKHDLSAQSSPHDECDIGSERV